MVRHRPPIGSTARARHLRRRRTKAEDAMWRILRAAFSQAHFGSQVPMRDFVADFASHKHKLIIEVDGGQHGGEDDAERTRLIEADGYQVIRFWNNDVLGNPDGVACIVNAALCIDSTPTPALPHQGGGSKSEHSQWHV